MTHGSTSALRRLFHTRLRDLFRCRIDGRLDWRRVVADANFPSDVTASITRVTSKTRLWRQEKLAVAQELIAHFQDGLEAGRTSHELLGDFGDEAATARLIRRAKRRCRPLWWQFWSYLRWVPVLLAALVAVLWLRIWLGTPTIDVDYFEQANARISALGDEEKAWPLYRQALEQIGFHNGRLPEGEVDWNEMPWHATDPDFVEFATKHAQALALIREAAGRKGIGRPLSALRGSDHEKLFSSDGWDSWKTRDPNNPMMYDIRLDEIEAYRAFLMLLDADARLAASQGDGERATANIVAQIGLGNQLQELPFLVPAMVAMAIHGAAYDQIDSLLREHPDLFSRSDLQTLAHAVAAAELDWRWWLEGERLAFLDFIQRLYTNDGVGDGRITDEGLRLMAKMVQPLNEIVTVIGVDLDQNSSRPNPLVAALSAVASGDAIMPLFLASRQEMIAMQQRLHDQAARDWETPAWKRTDPDPTLGLNRWPVLKRRRYALLYYLLPAFQASRSAYENSLGRREGTLIGLALELYRRETGSYPDKLAELSPRYLPSVPVDPLTGKPLHLVIVDGKPIVYSVGADQDDDGGVPPPGRNGNFFASPAFYRPHQPATAAEHDGDWILFGIGAQPKLSDIRPEFGDEATSEEE